MGTIKNISDEDFIKEALLATSVTDLLYRLNYSSSGPNSKGARQRAIKLQIDNPKLYTKDLNMGVARTAISLDEILVENSEYSNNQRIIKLLVLEGIKEYKCEIKNCPNPEPFWNGKKLTLQLDHIDGDNRNNVIENLRIICPNCHTQTETYCRGLKNTANKICSCGNDKSAYAETCRNCKDEKQNAIQYPSPKELQESYERLGSYSAVAREIGGNVTGNMIRQRMKKYPQTKELQ